ncbi:TonB-dependent siderophore receptor [Agrobacterium albertimagni AOL15]|uniref:TonB-dependent siderophore receptor n=1 Tax=Agrobacterium albertimagni AOL15 TaxID=1156935 RepID=K2PAG1_9HYPH|nr:TonB-dependent siderophore receptor [Agrobacterium albertimagni]EKF57923.1 TonB-dependent siderophore receptor [Agrobacterium albertimagni AOL15]
MARGEKERVEITTDERRRHQKTVLLASTMLACMVGFAPGIASAQAQTVAGATETISFQIPAQPLSAAINAFIRQSGWQISYSPVLAAGKTSTAVSGSMKPTAALQQIVNGTGITVRISGAGSAALVGPQGADAGLAAAEGSTVLDPITVVGDNNGANSFVSSNSTGALKTNTPLIETPQSVSVIGRKQMEAQNAQSVSEVLRYVPGVAIETYGPDPKGYDWIMMRGFNAQATSSYLDGLRQVSSSYSFFRTDPYALDSVEVLRGPSSSLYGQSDAGGIVNKTSRKPTADTVRQIEMQYGSHDRKQVAFDLGGAVNQEESVLYRIIGVARNANTQFEYSNGADIGDDRLMIQPAVTWKPDEDTTLTVTGQALKDKSGGTIMLFTPTNILLGDPNFNQSTQEQQSIGYEFEHRFDDTWTFRQNARYGHVDFTLDNLFLSGLSASGLNRVARHFDESFDTFSIDNQAQAEFETGALSHQALFGLDYSWSDADVRRFQGAAPSQNPYAPVYGVTVPTPTTPMISYAERYSQTGIYAQDQIKFGNGFVATLGGRYDWLSLDTHNRLTGADTDINIGNFSGRAGLSYVTSFGLAPYVSYSQSFVPNSGVDEDGNTFDPSKGRQWEAGLKYQPEGFDGLFTIAYFDIKKTNVLNYLANGFAVATGEIASRGLELEGKVSLGGGWDFVGSYTYTDAEITRDATGNVGKHPMLVPEQQASAWLNYTFEAGLLEGASLGAGVRYVGKVYGNNANTFSVPSRTLVDLGASYRINEHAKVSLNATNLFDKKYFSTCEASYSCYQGDRRTVIGKLTVDF